MVSAHLVHALNTREPMRLWRSKHHSLRRFPANHRAQGDQQWTRVAHGAAGRQLTHMRFIRFMSMFRKRTLPICVGA